MKNLYLLPTDKSSRLWIDLDSNELKFEKLSSPNSNECTKCLNQHIYITSYEKVKIGDWSTDGNLVVLRNKSNGHLFEGHFPKKIIITTDPDLIKDGVQQIDDVFLDWFVNNPTCEELNIFEHNRCCGRCMGVFEDLCYSDMTCDDHKELGCEICYGRRVEYMINIPAVGVFSEENKEDILISNLKITELTALIETWKQKQRDYEMEAEKHRSCEHTYKKYTYRAQATRDCWKELLSLIKKLE
jgi:hypothetical protein